MVAKVAIDSWNNVNILRNSRDRTKQINTALKTPRKKPRTRQKQIPHTRRLEVEYRRWTGTLYNFEVDGVEERANKLAF